MPAGTEEPVTVSQSAVVDALRHRIAQAADPERAPQMQAYMKSSMPFRGVSAAPMRRICREVFDEHRLREYAKSDEAWVVAFVRDHADQMSGLSRREALKNVGDH